MRERGGREEETEEVIPTLARCSARESHVLALMWLAFVFLPAVIGYLQGDLARVIEQRGLEPDGLFYTETDEVGEAYNYFGNSAFGSAPNAARSRE